ncbi:hypothetical protein Q5P01_006900 [Channa striata]|uniref:Uncharacterized protein n=1 Tax=Channa striata TaxID=64152 RepID=A0AA88T165_CHASR|nr:hypothetical protein Q5P01_006900 [Channa striata]
MKTKREADGERGKESERRREDGGGAERSTAHLLHQHLSFNQHSWFLDLLNEVGCLMKDSAVLDQALASPRSVMLLHEAPLCLSLITSSSSLHLCLHTTLFIGLYTLTAGSALLLCPQVLVVFVKILIAQVSGKWRLRVLPANELPGRGSVVSPSNTGLRSQIKVTFPQGEMSQRDATAEDCPAFHLPLNGTSEP